jgi:hypothetical protein
MSGLSSLNSAVDRRVGQAAADGEDVADETELLLDRSAIVVAAKQEHHFAKIVKLSDKRCQ